MRPRISRAWTSDRGGPPGVIAAQKFFSQYACTPLPDTGTQLPENTRLSTTVDFFCQSQTAENLTFSKVPFSSQNARWKFLQAP
jgi:hypothetical protein